MNLLSTSLKQLTRILSLLQLQILPMVEAPLINARRPRLSIRIKLWTTWLKYTCGLYLIERIQLKVSATKRYALQVLCLNQGTNIKKSKYSMLEIMIRVYRFHRKIPVVFLFLGYLYFLVHFIQVANVSSK